MTIFEEDTPLELINAIRPDVLIKGGDYRPDQVVGREEVEASGGRLVIVPLFEGHSTSRMVDRASERDLARHSGGPVPPRAPQPRSSAAGGYTGRTSPPTELKCGLACLVDQTRFHGVRYTMLQPFARHDRRL